MQIDRPIAIALTLFIIILLVFFFVMPEYNAFGQLQTQLAEKKAEFNAEFDYYAAIAKSYDALQARQDDIKKIDDALPKESSLGKLVYFIQEAAKENGLIIKDLFLSKSAGGNTGASVNSSDVIKDMVFSIDVLGDYSSLGSFIISLEKSSRIFEVTNISFSAATAQQSQPATPQFQTQQTYSFSMQLKTHSY
jgi:Tfp pilus assembly protein PilO